MDGGYIFELARAVVTPSPRARLVDWPALVSDDDAVRREAVWCANAEALSRGFPPLTAQEFDAVYAAHGVGSPPAIDDLLWPDWACGDAGGVDRLRARLQGAGSQTPTTWRTLQPRLAALVALRSAYARALALLSRGEWGDLLPLLARMWPTYPSHLADLDTLAAMPPNAARESVVLDLFSAWALHAPVDDGVRAAPIHLLSDADLVAAFVVAYRASEDRADINSSAKVACIIAECRARTSRASCAFPSWSFAPLFGFTGGNTANRKSTPPRPGPSEKSRLAEREAQATMFAAEKGPHKRISPVARGRFHRTWLGRKLAAYLE